jgi:hypothetical protein
MAPLWLPSPAARPERPASRSPAGVREDVAAGPAGARCGLGLRRRSGGTAIEIGRRREGGRGRRAGRRPLRLGRR